LEQLEKLEQLRVLALGQRIQVGVVAHAAAGVDTPEDYDQFVKQWSAAHPPVAIRQAA
jgi:CMP-2-keto-3-deoxyoctulosonic acid synthetase